MKYLFYFIKITFWSITEFSPTSNKYSNFQTSTLLLHFTRVNLRPRQAVQQKIPRLPWTETFTGSQNKGQDKEKEISTLTAKFSNVNQQPVESKKDHLHLPTPPNNRQLQSITPIAALSRHPTKGDKRKDQKWRKEGKNHHVSAKFQKQLFLFRKIWTTTSLKSLGRRVHISQSLLIACLKCWKNAILWQ